MFAIAMTTCPSAPPGWHHHPLQVWRRKQSEDEEMQGGGEGRMQGRQEVKSRTEFKIIEWTKTNKRRKNSLWYKCICGNPSWILKRLSGYSVNKSNREDLGDRDRQACKQPSQIAERNNRKWLDERVGMAKKEEEKQDGGGGGGGVGFNGG